MHFTTYKERRGLRFKDRILENSLILRSQSTAPCCIVSPGRTIPEQSTFNALATFLPLITHFPEKIKTVFSESRALGCSNFVGSNQNVESGV